MTDLEQAKVSLKGHSIAICKDGIITVRDEKGIAPMMHFIAENRDLQGYSVADLIVGKAAAMLFYKVGVEHVYGKVMSQSGKVFLEKNHIEVEYDTLAEHIVNRTGTGICPMEETVADLEDVNEAYDALCEKIKELKAAVPFLGN